MKLFMLIIYIARCGAVGVLAKKFRLLMTSPTMGFALK